MFQTDNTTCNLDGVKGSSSRHVASMLPFNVMSGMLWRFVLLCTSSRCAAGMPCCPVLVFCARISSARKYFCVQAQGSGISSPILLNPQSRQLLQQSNHAAVTTSWLCMHRLQVLTSPTLMQGSCGAKLRSSTRGTNGNIFAMMHCQYIPAWMPVTCWTLHLPGRLAAG